MTNPPDSMKEFDRRRNALHVQTPGGLDIGHSSPSPVCHVLDAPGLGENLSSSTPVWSSTRVYYSPLRLPISTAAAAIPTNYRLASSKDNSLQVSPFSNLADYLQQKTSALEESTLSEVGRAFREVTDVHFDDPVAQVWGDNFYGQR